MAAYRLPRWELLFKVLYDDATVQWDVKELEAFGLQVDFDETLQEMGIDPNEGSATPQPTHLVQPEPAQPPRPATSAAKTPGAAPQGEPPAKQAKRSDGDADVDIEAVAGAGDEWDEEATAAAADDADAMQN